MAQHYYALLSNDCVMSDLTDLSSRRLETRVDRESNLVKHQTHNWKQF